MFQIISAEEAAALVRDGDTICINSFLTLGNPEELHEALFQRFKETGHPKNLTLFCASGFGGWDEKRFADPIIAAGAVKCVIAGHFGSMPAAVHKAFSGEIEAYNMPLGVLSHTLRAAASRKDGYLSEVGLGLFVDPRVDGPGLNDKSRQELVKVAELEGREYLYYKTPKIDVALMRGTTVDPSGNITFEKECVSVDALATAQATKANGGIVIVQVERVSHQFSRPRNVIVPGVLVDAVVVCPEQKQFLDETYNPTLSGDIHVPPSHMNYWMGLMRLSGKRGNHDDTQVSHEIIGERAAKELQAGSVVNIGIGIPEMVGRYASKSGMLEKITLTVESGGIGGLPAPGIAFGATIGADIITDMAQQFDFYDGGGIRTCFMGGYEVDRYGNVNAHVVSGRFAGIGGFANITTATPNVVFCMTFSAIGLKAERRQDGVHIAHEGKKPKFKPEIEAISFSAKHSRMRGQNVLYVTERCVFALGDEGLELAEVYQGIDLQKDILDQMEFVPKIRPGVV
jgi:propionate CoA-transferase